jgi:cell division inhibitor SepF
MAGFLRKAMDYLGLDDDGGYQDYDPYEDQPAAPVRRPAAAAAPDSEPALVYPKSGYSPSSVTVTAAGDNGVMSVMPVGAAPRAVSPTVRTVTPVQSNKVHMSAPTSFADAQEIGERFRSGQLVLMNVRETERDLIKRLVDFSSGLIYGLNGDIKKVADRVFLLTPSGVDLSPDEEKRLRDKGLFT